MAHRAMNSPLLKPIFISPTRLPTCSATFSGRNGAGLLSRIIWSGSTDRLIVILTERHGRESSEPLPWASPEKC
jgi:hypothetical protein